MNKQETRERIIHKATELFTSYGYSKVSMSDLAEKLGMSKKTLYAYFESKETLLQEIVNAFMTELSTKDQEILANTEISFLEKTTQVMTLIATKMSSISPYFIDDVSKNAPKVWNSIQEYKREAAFHRFDQLMTEGMQKGYIKKNLNKDLAVVFFASAVETVFSPNFMHQLPLETVKNLPYSQSAVFEGLLQILFEGILIKEA
jgi:AcrR family transcriptional regulator